jgi:hypothetical protein
MSDVEEPSGRHHRYVREVVERISEHHDRAVQQREEEDLSEAVGEAVFDMGADISHPMVRHAALGYDVDADLGMDKEPPELRA